MLIAWSTHLPALPENPRRDMSHLRPACLFIMCCALPWLPVQAAPIPDYELEPVLGASSLVRPALMSLSPA